MRVAVVVQRYGLEVAGGAELHARYVAEMLAERHEVTVLTTTARDYVTWRAHYPAGRSEVNGVTVLRFPVERERDELRFAAAVAAAAAAEATIEAEHHYLEEQGPLCPALPRHVAANPTAYDAIVAFSYRYLTTQAAAGVAPLKTILVPTAEDDPAIHLRTSGDLFRSVAACAFNTPEERALLCAAAGAELAGEVVGVFSEIPERPDPERFRTQHGVAGPYLLYIGRIDRNKGCVEMFREFAAWSAETGLPHHLLLIGSAVLPIPDHPRIRHLGFVSDEAKFDALAGATVLLMPSPYESLSMVTLEAMALGIPPLVNGRCTVLAGQVRRSNAGLYHTTYDEMFEALSLLVENPELRARLGANGRRFYEANYARPVVATAYERLLGQLGNPGADRDRQGA